MSLYHIRNNINIYLLGVIKGIEHYFLKLAYFII
jgi:hypothetical protein